jgi:hypothetical protein
MSVNYSSMKFRFHYWVMAGKVKLPGASWTEGVLLQLFKVIRQVQVFILQKMIPIKQLLRKRFSHNSGYACINWSLIVRLKMMVKLEASVYTKSQDDVRLKSKTNRKKGWRYLNRYFGIRGKRRRHFVREVVTTCISCKIEVNDNSERTIKSCCLNRQWWMVRV